MKREFIDSLFTELIVSKGYMPIRDERDEIYRNHNVEVLVNNSYGTFYLLEIIDADLFSIEEIKDRLDVNRAKLMEFNYAVSQYIIELFVFNSEPDAEKVRLIEEMQVSESSAKKFLKSLSINLDQRSVSKHYKIPATTLGLGKIIERQLKKENYETISDSSLSQLVRQKEEEGQINFKAKKPLVTYSLIAINILVWLGIIVYGYFKGENYNQLLTLFGEKNNFLILQGEYWRFFTPIFLHGGILHLALNCYSLYALGASVERIFGHFKFTGVYLIAGIFGNILSFIFSINPSVGASGAIFGLLGALLYFGLAKPSAFKTYFGNDIFIVIFINLAYGMSNSGIDNFAHIGGLLGGFIASGAISNGNYRRWYLNRIIYAILMFALAFGGLFYGFNNKQNSIVGLINEIDHLQAKNMWKESEVNAEKILDMKPQNKAVLKSVLWSLVRAEAMNDDYQSAVEHAKELQEFDAASSHYLLGVLYFDMQRYDDSMKELLEARKLNPNNPSVDKIIKDLENLQKLNK